MYEQNQNVPMSNVQSAPNYAPQPQPYGQYVPQAQPQPYGQYVPQQQPQPQQQKTSKETKEELRAKLSPESNVLVHGLISFARIVSFIEGEELDKRNKRDEAKGHYPTKDPYTTISIVDPVIDADPDPASQALKRYIEALIYPSKSGRFQGHPVFSIKNKGKFLPGIYEKHSDGAYHPIHPAIDPANGQPVQLLIKTYSYNTNGNKGVSIGLQGILFDSEYKARTSVGMNSEYLSGHGIVIAASDEEETDEEAPVQPAQAPAPMQAPAQPAPTNFGYAPQQPGQFAQPVQPQQPAQFAQPVQPAPSQFAQPVQPQPGQFAQPVQAPAQGGQVFGYNPAQAGITYDANK